MKKVLVHWIEMATLEVPDECPTEESSEFERWIYDNDKSFGHEPYSKNGTFCVEQGTRDFEIVKVKNIKEETEEETEEQKVIKSIKENYETDKVWNTEQLQEDFIVHNFLAPFVTVTRKSDNKKGTLKFLHSPRFYFCFEESSNV